MSYVLDALKKADAERERGSVPGLHAQPVPLSPDLESKPAAKPWVWTIAGAAVAVLVCVLVWRWAGHDDAAASPVASAPEVSAPMAVAVPAVTSPTAAVPSSPIALRTPERSAAQTAAMAPPPSAAASKRSPAGVKSDATIATVPGVAPTAKTTTPAVAVAASAAGDARIPTQAELPDDLRHGLPALAIGGSIYSDSPSSRFLIINGQIFHEGDKLAPDLTLVQIRLKLAVLNYKGTRFSIAY